MLAALLLFALSAVPAYANLATPEFPDSTNADAMGNIYRAALGACMAIFVLVGGWLLYTAIRFRTRRGETPVDPPPQTHGSSRLEIGWTIVPILILAGLAGYTFNQLGAAENISTSRNALHIAVTAQQFTFTYTYPNGKAPSNAAILVVPVDTPIDVSVVSKDVNHDWWVPSLAPKVDAIPGQVNHTGFTPTHVGTFKGQCAEFCGAGHATMTITVRVVSKADFTSYMAGLK
jgi:cytochrome c oxidase subunit II